MTPEEKAAHQELVKLQKAATKLGVTFTPETTIDQLAALVAEAQTAAAAAKIAAKELDKARKAAAKANVVLTDDMTVEQIHAAIKAVPAGTQTPPPPADVSVAGAAAPASLTAPVEGQACYYVWNE